MGDQVMILPSLPMDIIWWVGELEVVEEEEGIQTSLAMGSWWVASVGVVVWRMGDAVSEVVVRRMRPVKVPRRRWEGLVGW